MEEGNEKEMGGREKEREKSWNKDMLQDSDVRWQYKDSLSVGHHCGKQTCVSVCLLEVGLGWGATSPPLQQTSTQM